MLNAPEIVENKTNETNTQDIEFTVDTIVKNTETTEFLEENNSPEISGTISSESVNSNESVNIEIESANTTNCLALTIQKDHKLVAVKNVVIKSIRITWKVIVSTITLGIIKLFS